MQFLVSYFQSWKLRNFHLRPAWTRAPFNKTAASPPNTKGINFFQWSTGDPVSAWTSELLPVSELALFGLFWINSKCGNHSKFSEQQGKVSFWLSRVGDQASTDFYHPSRLRAGGRRSWSLPPGWRHHSSCHNQGVRWFHSRRSKYVIGTTNVRFNTPSNFHDTPTKHGIATHCGTATRFSSPTTSTRHKTPFFCLVRLLPQIPLNFKGQTDSISNRWVFKPELAYVWLQDQVSFDRGGCQEFQRG